MWTMLIAVAEGQDDASIHLIWDNGNQLRMMLWALAAVVDGLRMRDIDPLDFARYSIKHALSTEEGKEGQKWRTSR